MKKIAIMFFLLFIIFPPIGSAQRKIPILVYHSIDEFHGQGSKELYVTPTNFEKQMIYLRDHGFSLLTLEKWQDIYTKEKPIFITLDDGYKNNLKVYDIFQKIKNNHFIPSATMFVITDFIGNANRLSNTELKRLADSGLISVQSHTATHPDLTKTTDYKQELKDSKETIEKITGKEVIALSYPYGNIDSKTIDEVKKYYSFGLTTTPELYLEKGIKNEHYLLPRVYIKHSTTLEEFADIVEGK
ncbi:polysaccharide deacetylase family protein [Cytobacillus oceanisediminis]|uniref:Polysaccharide deacetylase family protein n=1 Tax=Niallia alba TaxID=2729105 RepID=A0A7Y0K6Y1_9BACI|nr:MULTISPECIES: polysaccharide deacetylase family protein [Bacillaceae]MBZ9535967.1 polysaccharide deacetylase family protein [Cytobacillus oceanisediminis]NMO76898.1 polysaccharide deacetylase family protein [Niallia alba]UTI40101.1 polysaccharide deacetylase family protein [Niallia sp. RD1]